MKYATGGTGYVTALTDGVYTLTELQTHIKDIVLADASVTLTFTNSLGKVSVSASAAI